jgi:hypothetical protein
LHTILLPDLHNSSVHELVKIQYSSNSYVNKWVDIFQGVAEIWFCEVTFLVQCPHYGHTEYNCRIPGVATWRKITLVSESRLHD